MAELCALPVSVAKQIQGRQGEESAWGSELGGENKELQGNQEAIDKVLILASEVQMQMPMPVEAQVDTATWRPTAAAPAPTCTARAARGR